MRPIIWSHRFVRSVCLCVICLSFLYQGHAVAAEPNLITGLVQNQDLRRVDQAIVQVRDQEGTVVTQGVTNQAGEFSVLVSQEGTYSVSRKDIEVLPLGNNNTVAQVLQTVPSVVYGALGETHIRQDHANHQFRIDGVPIPEGGSSSFTDVISPRRWERADIILGGMEAQYGNKTALVVDITSKSGTRPPFGSAQMLGGSNQTVNPSFEYGGTVGEKGRYYALNSYTSTNRGIEPPTIGHSVFHDQSERNQTYLRGDYQHNNRNSVSWVFLNAVAKYQIPTIPGLGVNPDVLPLLQAQA